MKRVTKRERTHAKQLEGAARRGAARVVAVALLGTAPSVPAAWGACPTSPTNYDAEDCDVGGTDVCTLSGTTWTCDVSSAGGRSQVIVVEDFTAATDFEAWGESNGTLFCCDHTATGVDEIHIQGSAYDDMLQFESDATLFNLKDSGQPVIGRIYGNGGGDLINGSDYSSVDFSEFLYGGDDNDTVHAHGGDDYLEGNAGNDTLNGDGGDDEMYGNDGFDIMRGGAGDDLMYGGATRDRMDGGDGNDTMDGGEDGDTMCGGGEGASGDYLYDGDSVDESTLGRMVDELWASVMADENKCDHTSTMTDSAATTFSCTNTVLTTKPSQCP